MIKKYTFGNVLETEAVVEVVPVTKGEVPYLTKIEDCEYVYPMGDTDIIYGLGENMRGINKRGWIYQSKCVDINLHTETTSSLYAAHNFLLVRGNKKFGIFFDYPGIITFDIGYEKYNQMKITLSDGNYDLYIIDGDSEKDIIRQFRKLVGRSYIPPKWAFGYGQSRWGYKNEADIREVAANFKDNGLPIDSIYLDIDYMQDYKDFTVNSERFPDLKELVEECKEQNIHLVPIIDAGVKIEPGYDVYEEGIAKNYFCKNEDGTDFVAAVWPGKVHFPDVLNKEAREWFGDKYSRLLELGIDGFWNDMNEPSIFYTEKRLQEVMEKIQSYMDKDMNLEEYWDFTGSVNSLGNNEDDYKEFYHNIDGEKVRHDRVHNLYGYNMTKAAGEAFERLMPEKRILMFSRSSYIGMHRYGGIWMGDNKSWWQHILLNMQMLPSLNMCGFLYIGADLGGFGDNTTEDMLLRWLELGIFTPLMRNHSACERSQEPYRFERIDRFRDIMGLRYGLVPYLYSEYMKAALNHDMMFQPLSFEYPEDERAAQVEDQLLVGESIMIAPVYVQNAKGRSVYLPETMKMVKFRSLSDYEEQVLEQGYHYIDIDIHEVAVFIRPGHMLPMAKGGQNVEEIDYDNLKMFTYDDSKVSYVLYNDDGKSKDYQNKNNCIVLNN